MLISVVVIKHLAGVFYKRRNIVVTEVMVACPRVIFVIAGITAHHIPAAYGRFGIDIDRYIGGGIINESGAAPLVSIDQNVAQFAFAVRVCFADHVRHFGRKIYIYHSDVLLHSDKYY